jgi:hypothetical protein
VPLGIGALITAGVFAWHGPATTATPITSRVDSSAMSVDCEPSQQAIVHQHRVNGEIRVGVQCVTAGASAREVSYAAAPAPADAPVLIPATYETAPRDLMTPAVYAPRTSTVRTTAAPRSAAPVRRVEHKRSWQKRALVIGGAAGAGAGIGGLIGGKKGALIGAAIGGGGATIFETRR